MRLSFRIVKSHFHFFTCEEYVAHFSILIFYLVIYLFVRLFILMSKRVFFFLVQSTLSVFPLMG